jgi:hypothetical protein
LNAEGLSLSMNAEGLKQVLNPSALRVQNRFLYISAAFRD